MYKNIIKSKCLVALSNQQPRSIKNVGSSSATLTKAILLFLSQISYFCIKIENPKPRGENYIISAN